MSAPTSNTLDVLARLADVIESARKAHGPITHHTHAIVVLVEYPRDPRPDEPGCDWIVGTQPQRAAVLAAQTAVLLASYLRMLGFDARSHTATCSDVSLNRLAVGAVEFELTLRQTLGEPPALLISCSDSGPGFDHQLQVEQARCEPTTEEMLKGHGRGIPLLLRVCEEVRYSGPGNRVEVVFRLAERAIDSPR